MTLVDEHPLVQEVDGKLADWARRKEEFEQRVAPLAEQDAAAEEAYAKAVDAALLHGGEMPEPPVRRLPLGRDVELRLSFMQEQQQLIEERRRVVAAAFPDVLRDARSQARRLVKQARPTLEKLIATWGDVGSLLAAVQACRDAANAENPEGFRQFQDSRLDIDAFARLVATGADATAILDLPGAPPVLSSRRDGLTRADIQQLIAGGGIAQPADESSVPELTPDRPLGFGQPEDPEQDEDRSGQRVPA